MQPDISATALTVGRNLKSAAARFPAQIAIETESASLTYAELSERMNRLGHAAHNQLDLSPGSIVALLSSNRIEYIEIVLGLAEAGIIVATLNPGLTAEELRAILDNCSPSLAIIDTDLSALADCLDAKGVPQISLGQDYEALLMGALPVDVGGATEIGAFAISYTSGTTGTPKGVVIPHRSRALISLASQAEYQCFGYKDRFLALAPMYHGAGFAFALAAVSYGGTCVLHQNNDAESILIRLETDNIDSIFMVPTHFNRIHDLPEERFLDFANNHSLRTIISNAAALSPRLKQLTVARFGDGLLHETYGSTEAGIVTNMRPDLLLAKPESVGGPFLGMEVEIRDKDGSLCAPGEIGELFSRGPYTFLGYLNRQKETDEAVKDGWVTVQDLAMRDEDGAIYILGRSKDMIVSGGINVYPAEIEGIIATAPGVLEVAAVGLADDEWGEVIHAFLVPEPESNLDVREIEALCRENLAGYKVPKGFTVLSELPRNVSGKILKKILREHFND